MKWASLHDFIAMGGYGGYVWSAYGMLAALLAIEMVLLMRRAAQVRKQARVYARRGKAARAG
jgi:heme exporter protein D